MSEEAQPPTDVQPAAREDPTPALRQLTDPRDMRALAHPIRLALLEVLAAYGPLTATQAGELIGESASSCSFHLRTLARHNFVEETGDGRGRQRPWRLVSIGMQITDAEAGSEKFIAATALAQIAAERQLNRLRQWWRLSRDADPEWLNAASQSDFMSWLTPEELREVNDAVTKVLFRYHGRLSDPALRPPGSKLVEMLYFSYPSAIGQPEADPVAEDPALADDES
jgi:DNA-binding transcriptional ArsR family regulator